MRILEHRQNSTDLDLFRLGDFSVELESLNASSSLVIFEEFGPCRIVGEIEIRKDSPAYGKDALEAEDPSPPGKACDAIHLRDGGSQEPREGSAERCRRPEQRDPEREFLSSVEAAEVQDDSREQSSFHQAQEEAAGNQAGIVLHKALQSRDDAPGKAKEWNIDARTNLLDDQVGRDLAQDIRDVGNRDCCTPLNQSLSLKTENTTPCRGLALRLCPYQSDIDDR